MHNNFKSSQHCHFLIYSGTKKRGRPKKSEQEKREAAEAKTPTPAPDHTSRAAEGLLELSNTGKFRVY